MGTFLAFLFSNQGVREPGCPHFFGEGDCLSVPSRAELVPEAIALALRRVDRAGCHPSRHPTWTELPLPIRRNRQLDALVVGPPVLHFLFNVLLVSQFPASVFSVESATSP